MYQQSAGIFAHLKGITPAIITQEPTPDLNPDSLHALSALMLAQAQETFVHKAIRDSMKEAIVAKLSSQCEDLYADALRALQKDSVRTLWDKDWISTVSGKHAGFQAITQLYQSLVCRNNKAVGEELARLQQSVELFKTAQSRSGRPSLFEEFAGRAQRNYAESKKDNDLIYNEMIPDFKSLPAPGKAMLAKAIPVTGRLDESGKDLFEHLVPVALHQALRACDARKSEVVNVEISKLREATQTLNGVLASLNLPAAIETTSSGSLPPSLLTKAAEVRNLGGIDNVRKLIEDMPDLLTRNRELLDEADRMLNEEADADAKLRAQFKERWTRSASDKLTEGFRSNLAKYREVTNSAVSADKIVRDKFANNENGIEILSKPEQELSSVMPSGDCGGNVGECSSARKLWQLMERVATVKAERDVVESELKSATVDMKEQFLAALAADGAINEPVLSVGAIGKQLGPLQQQAAESLSAQEKLIAEIQQAHESFAAETGSANGTREGFLTELANAHNTFKELQDNLKEAFKFYNHLTEVLRIVLLFVFKILIDFFLQLLIPLQNKISDFCFARKTEKEELMKDLTHESSRTPPAKPSMPTHGTNPQAPAPASSAPAQSAGPVPYPSQMQGMPIPYGASPHAPYPTYVQPPMPPGYNPTLPYPNSEYSSFANEKNY